jgi:gamma-polyglutamate biosynthesis protein CapA
MVKKIAFASLLIILIVGSIVVVGKNRSEKQLVKPIPTQEIQNKPQISSEAVTVISTGDIGLVRDVNQRIIQKKDPNYPFLKIADYLRDADLTITNLEGPLIRNCPITLTGFTFCGDAGNVKGLKFAGIDAASIANNHTTNYGLEGLYETVMILEQEGIRAYGTENNITYINIKGIKFALVGFVELGNNWSGLNNATVQNIQKLVTQAQKTSDSVIVSFHWGEEYTHQPGKEQVKLAHIAVDSGADLILGNHPHWIQINEIYKGKFITYAQGNTIFDQDWSQETKEGVLYKYVYREGRFEKIDEKYTIIEDNSQPRFATDEETEKIKAKLTNQ